MSERDSVPLAGHRAVLHAVTLSGGRPVDSARTDRAGRYTLSATRRDTAHTYLVSVRYAGIAHFSEPMRPGAPPGDTAGTITVYDTSSTGPPIRLAQRTLLIRGPESDGSRRVIELVVLANRGRRTRIAGDSTNPVWRGTIPQGAVRFEVGEGDVSEQAVLRDGDAIAVVAPIPPGERQLLLAYIMPRSTRSLTIAFDQPAARVSVLLEDTTATVPGTLLSLLGIEEFEGRMVPRYGADSVAAGQSVAVRFGSPRASPVALWWVPVLLAAVAMAVTLAWWWRGPAPRETDDPAVLAARIAALDAGFAGQETEDYRQRRAELKRRLADALARDESRA